LDNHLLLFMVVQFLQFLIHLGNDHAAPLPGVGDGFAGVVVDRRQHPVA